MNALHPATPTVQPARVWSVHAPDGAPVGQVTRYADGMCLVYEGAIILGRLWAHAPDDVVATLRPMLAHLFSAPVDVRPSFDVIGAVGELWAGRDGCLTRLWESHDDQVLLDGIDAWAEHRVLTPPFREAVERILGGVRLNWLPAVRCAAEWGGADGLAAVLDEAAA